MYQRVSVFLSLNCSEYKLTWVSVVTDDFSEMTFEVSQGELQTLLDAINKPMVLSGYRFEVRIKQIADFPVPGETEEERLN